ncbi:MAG: serine hydrolase [Bacteroidota bacterium]
MLRLGLLLVLLTCFSVPGIAQSTELDTTDVSVRLDSLRAAYGTPGMAVAVVHRGRVIYARGFGYRDLERQLPVTVETAFPIGSVTKQFTASLIGLYEHEGRLSLSDRPAEHLPGLRFRTPTMDALVTIEDLLTHQSGIGGVDGAMVHFPDIGRQTLRVDRLAHLDPETEVRERLAYSNAAYGLLGTISEHVSGRTWSEEIHDRLFAPLGMTRSSTSIPSLRASGDIATGYGMVDGEPEAGPYEDLHEASPGGSINSTALDLAAWVQMLICHGQHDGTQVLPADFLARAFSIQSFWQPSYDPAGGQLHVNGYGYGWHLTEFEGRLRIAHSGAVSGFTARAEFLPSEHIGVVVLTNQHVSGLPDWAAEIVYRDVLDLPPRTTDSFPVNVVPITPIVRDSGSVAYPDLNAQRPPTHPLAQYTGPYTHPGYGTFTVTLREGALYADFPAFSFALQHEQTNVFRLRRTYEVHVNTPDFPVHFRLGFDGSVVEASIPMQAESVVFMRDSDALRAETRRQLDEADRVTDGAARNRQVASALRDGLASGVHTEASINALGYEYLSSERVPLAIAVFEFNASAFPDSWNVHDSLGEGLAVAGRTEDAIAAYERSLALNPGNTYGRAALDRLQSE